MTYPPKEKRFVMGARRQDRIGAKRRRDQRVGGVPRFDRVRHVSHLGLEGEPDKVRNLLGVNYSKTEEPSGLVFLKFAPSIAAPVSFERRSPYAPARGLPRACRLTPLGVSP